VSNDSAGAAFGAKQSFVFVADLVFNSTSSCADLGAAERPRVELQYFTFERNSTISLGSNATGSYQLSFDISPSFTKFTLRLFHWPWLGADSNRVEVDINISSPFASSVPLPAADGDTTLELRGQARSADGRPYSTQVRLVRAVTLDDVLVLATNDTDDRAAVEFAFEEQLSKLVLSFARFNTSLEYDPGNTRHYDTHGTRHHQRHDTRHDQRHARDQLHDATRRTTRHRTNRYNHTDIGVLLGRKDDGGSDSNLAIIVGTAVAVPVAIGLVLVVIAVGVVVLKWRSKLRGRREAINIDHTDFAEPDTEQL
jgi:hypothetical protein